VIENPIAYGKLPEAPTDSPTFTGEIVYPRGQIQDVLADAQADLGPVSKASWNDFHKFKFRGIDAILDAVSPALAKHRVLVMPKVLKVDSRDSQTDKGKTQREVTMTIRYRFIGPRGDHYDATVVAEGVDTGDKAVSKAWSVAQRTVFIQVFSIRTGEADPDAARSAGRGVSQPVIDARLVLKGIAESKGKTGDDALRWITGEFHAWSTGGDFLEADAVTLKDFARVLDPTVEPTRKVQRRQG
jgi:hypothetical protein